jgi:hypothetical protein
MTDGKKRRLVERIADPSYVEGLTDRTVEDLRDMREECREGENELSFERRLCQARIDILQAELDRREGKHEGDLMSRLPEILATEGHSGGSSLPSRAPDFSIPRNADIPRRRVEEVVGEQTLARLSSIPPEEIAGIITSLQELESTVSARRKKVQEVMDQIQSEIVRRYTSGEADPASLAR